MQELMKVHGGGAGEAPSMESMMMMGKMLLEEPKMKELIMKLLPRLLHQGSLDM